MADTLIYKVVLPPVPEGSDVDKQALLVVIDNVIDGNQILEKEVTEVSGVRIPQNASVRIELAYIDDAGNRSPQVSTLEFQAIDTIPPPIPGNFGVVLEGEEEGTAG